MRLLAVRYAEARRLDDGTASGSLHLMALLKSVSAFEAFRKLQAAPLQAAAVAEFLLLSAEFPRAVRFCIGEALDAVKAIAADGPRSDARGDRVQRALGPIRADLDYLDADTVLDDRLVPYLEQLLARIRKVGEEIESTYFSTHVVLPAPRAEQAQQQQQ